MRRRVELTPGFHWLEVASSKRGRNGELTRQSLPLTVEPCTTYRYAAKHDGSLSNRRWTIIGIEALTDLDCPANSGETDGVKDKQVAVAISGAIVGRQLIENDVYVSDMKESDVKKLKIMRKLLKLEEIELLKEIINIKRKDNPLWGV